MPRAFPTQIIGYLTKSFGSRLNIHPTAILDKIGEVAGFLELYDQLPPELIRLSADDYAPLIAAIGTVRYRIDQFQLPPVSPPRNSAARTKRRALGSAFTPAPMRLLVVSRRKA
jgi:hypothetical protein